MTGRVVVTGAYGFLGWHLRVRLAALTDWKVVPAGREEFASPSALAAAVDGSDVVFHVAGANRGEAQDVASTNVALAEELVAALRASHARPVVVYANSVQADGSTSYGVSKAAAAEILSAWALDVGGRFVDVVLPNVFGEHGRPGYNSFVATFCDELVSGREPLVNDPDARVDLLHAQAAAQALMDGVDAPAGRYHPTGVTRKVGEVLATLRRFVVEYRGADVPATEDPFDRALFSTYRSFVGPVAASLRDVQRSDQRGSLVEAVRNRSGAGQTFVSTTVPGETRGDHFHLAKFERFLVVRGTAEIRLRRVLHDEVVRLRVSGDDAPAVVDMPSMWAHAIENVGTDELVTLFWTDELFDPGRPDTYREVVGARAGGVA